MDHKRLFVVISVLMAMGIAVGMVYDSWVSTPSRSDEVNVQYSIWRFEWNKTDSSYHLVLGPGEGMIRLPVANP